MPERRSVPFPVLKPYRGPRPTNRPAAAKPDPRRLGPDPEPAGPAVVAIGGGTGLSNALRAVRRYAGTITAIVSVADDGGSSGRLRRDLGVPAPGDLRKCLVALAGGNGPWVHAFEHRFGAGELRDHALGNLLLVGLAETLGDLTAALDEAGRLVGAVGRVLPATSEPVTLAATVGAELVVGQVAIETAGGPVTGVHVVPASAAAPPAALDAIARADQVVMGPGSLFTSVLAALSVPDIRAAVAASPARTVSVSNLTEEPETRDLDGTDHLRMLLSHDIRVDALVYDPQHGLPVDEVAVKEHDVLPVAASITAPDGLVHDPAQLANALSALL